MYDRIITTICVINTNENGCLLPNGHHIHRSISESDDFHQSLLDRCLCLCLCHFQDLCHQDNENCCQFPNQVISNVYQQELGEQMEAISQFRNGLQEVTI